MSTSDRALGPAMLKPLDHHRVAVAAVRAIVRRGETFVSIKNKRIAGVFVEVGGSETLWSRTLMARFAASGGRCRKIHGVA